MQLTRYAQILGELSSLINVARAVSQRLVGTAPSISHQSYSDPIFTKILCHAISLRTLSPQLSEIPTVQLWDMASACAVARCIIEAHDVLEYVALCEISTEERDFRLLVWRLHDQQRRSKMLNFIQSTEPAAIEIHRRAQELTSEAISHPWFGNLNKQMQGRIRSGDAPSFLLSQRELNLANDVNHEYHTAATMMLSQYVHTLPMSVHQLAEFTAGTPEALHMSSLPIQYSLGFFARSISRMVEVFPSADQELSDSEVTIFSNWNAVVQSGVTVSSWQGSERGSVA